MTIEVSNESAVAVDESALADVARFSLERLRIHPGSELSVLLVDEPTMERLNRQWMDETGATDVLSFPMDELRPPAPDEEAPLGLLGDVVLCPAVAERQARDGGSPGGAPSAAGADPARATQDELELLCVHGVLHLLGHDHAEPDEERTMFRLQSSLLQDWRASRAASRGDA